MNSFETKYRAVIAGSTGGIGKAFFQLLKDDENCAEVIGLSRSTDIPIDFADEQTIADAAQKIGSDVDLLIDATGFLSDETTQPERALRHINAANMTRLFEANTIGPALLLKHFAPLFPRKKRAIFASLSARVGSIGDNHIGGWYSYRASKAAQNMIVKCAAIELCRNQKETICVSLHPGTVETALSDPFAGKRDRFTPEQSAAKLLSVIDGLSPEQSGGFLAYDGTQIEW